MEKVKDCELVFLDKTPPYPFNSGDIGKALETAHERGWRISAIKTPHYMLSIFSHEEYEKVTNDSFFTNIGV